MQSTPLNTSPEHQRVVLAVAGGLGLLVFIGDALTPLGIVAWVFYLPLCALVAALCRVRDSVAAGITATLLIVIGTFLSPAGVPTAFGVGNRALGIASIWLTIGLTGMWARAASRSIREISARLAGLVDTAEDAIISVDAAQRINLFNKGAERVFGYAAAEVMGKDLRMLLPQSAGETHAKHVREFGASALSARRMAERTAVAGRRKDGTEFRAEVSISKSRTREGLSYTAILRDITERVRSEELLRERERRLGLALSAGQMGTFDIDEERGIVHQDATANALLELPAEQTEFPLDVFYRRVHPRDREVVRSQLERLRREGGDSLLEFRVALPDGADRWLAAQGFCELHPDGSPRRTTGVVHDITQRKQVEQSLEERVQERTTALRQEIARHKDTQASLVRSQKLQAMGELAGGLAHDVNNQLTVITGNLELLGLRVVDEKARDLMRRAEEAAKMAARLTQRLLAFGRRQRLKATTINLSEIAQGMSDVLKRTLGDDVELVTTFAPDAWPAYADVSEVENAILNLAINARDAMPNGGKLFLETVNKALGPSDVGGESGVAPGDYAMLSITDTGVGMTPEVLARVFEPFFTTKEPGRGTGLGLSTIYGFAKQSGGHLSIYSEPGRGTSVRLYLPRAGAPESLREGRPEAAPTAEALGQTVLVVEDNAEVREVTLKRLDMLGYRVLSAENARAAVEILKGEAPIELVLSDVVMPGGMSGFDLARWVRENKPTVKILLTSGFVGQAARNGESAHPDIQVLHKPYALAELARAIRETMDS